MVFKLGSDGEVAEHPVCRHNQGQAGCLSGRRQQQSNSSRPQAHEPTHGATNAPKLKNHEPTVLRFQ